ncbi:dUTP diphosphatase [Corynebacterium sp. YSMAA1_1_F7]|uniref:dUTP diphosphatase n=1 Tax=Corynebacterium sp. YSMAA1_1_F7 TaxID=3383590 RepID=UPI0038D10A66
MTMPNIAHAGDAGLDLTSTQRVIIPPGGWELVPTGARNLVPAKHVGLVCPRSGLAARHGVTVLNAPGVIDAGYEGEVKVILINHGVSRFVVEPGDKVAQLVVLELPGMYEGLQPVKGEARGGGGFGSTGA